MYSSRQDLNLESPDSYSGALFVGPCDYLTIWEGLVGLFGLSTHVFRCKESDGGAGCDAAVSSKSAKGLSNAVYHSAAFLVMYYQSVTGGTPAILRPPAKY